jgi:hypothetical protein
VPLVLGKTCGVQSLTLAAEKETSARGFDRLTLTVSIDNEPAQALYRGLGYVDFGVPPKRVQGTIELRSGLPRQSRVRTVAQRRSRACRAAARTRAAGAEAVWGRGELKTGEMWNSNSIVAWLIARSDADAFNPPTGGGAPGWNAGPILARRQLLAAETASPAPTATARGGKGRAR